MFGKGIFRVPAAGGTPTAVTTPGAGTGDHRFAWFLPDGRHFLYTDTATDASVSGIYVGDLESKDRKRLVAAESNAVYSPPGYLLFVRDGTLLAQPFDTGKLQTSGAAVPIAEQVDSNRGYRTAYEFSVSRNGVLAYPSGRNGGGNLLTWFDHSGKVAGSLGAPNAASWGAISPDGRSVAVDRIERGLTNIWLHDLARGIASQLTFGSGNNKSPGWSPDGRYVTFYSERSGKGQPFRRAINGTGQDEVLSKTLGDPPVATPVEDWSRDGRYLALGVFSQKTMFDIWVLPFNAGRPGDQHPYPYLQTDSREWFTKISPDGHWLLYESDTTKRNEIYVQPFPTPGDRWQVSTDGGERPIWSRDGKEIYFISSDGKMMAAEVKSGSKFETGAPKPLFNVRLPGGIDPWFDVTKDGRFLIPQEPPSMTAPMTVVVNWPAALKK